MVSGNYFRGQLSRIVPNALRQEIDKIKQDKSIITNAQLILNLCKIITNKLDIQLRKQYIQESKRTILLYDKGEKSSIKDDMEEEQIMIYGAQLIYMIRTFLFNEKITYHFGVKNSKGEHLADAFVSQDQVLKNLSKISGKNAIGVTNAIQKELIKKQKGKGLKTTRPNLWSRVVYLSEVVYNENSQKIDMDNKEKNVHWAYQNQKMDNFIYLKFSGKQKIKYYDMKGTGKRENLMPFNTGNLWEWYNSQLYGADDATYNYIYDSIQIGRLLPIMQGQDFIRGTKQGDFKAANGQWIQSKYGNEKIISYNNIRQVVFQLQKSLEEFINNNNDQTIKDNLIDVLQEHFIPEAVNIGEKDGKQIVDDLLNKFQAKVNVQINF